MKNKLGYLLPFLFLIAAFSPPSKSIYDFKVQDIDGKEFNFSTLKGKKILIVNTASKCGFTPQYRELEELHNKYKNKNVVVIGFPANNFMRQEPGDDKEIKEFCTKNYGVSFPMMSKISVKGDDIHPLYKWLTTKSENGVSDAEVTWNFSKFLIDENGKWVAAFRPKVNPTSEEITKLLEK